MELLSEAEENKRIKATEAVNQIKQQLQSGAISQADAIHQLIDKESICRLQADHASSPIYAEAAMSLACECFQPEQIIDQFKVIYKSRAQCQHTQLLCSEIVRDKFLGDEKLRSNVQYLGRIAELLKGSIVVEHIYIEVQIRQMENYMAQDKLSEAATIAEGLQTDTAMQLPLHTKLQYIYQQIQCLNRLNDHVRTILIFQKFNENATAKEMEQITDAGVKEQATETVSRIYIEMADTYFKTGQLSKMAEALYKSQSGRADEAVMCKALYVAFCCQNTEVMERAGSEIVAHKWDYALYWEIIASKTIQNVAVVDQLGAALARGDAQLEELHEQFVDGFIKYQFGKIRRVFSQIGFQRVEALLGVEIGRLERLLVQMEVPDVEIDRLAGVIAFRGPGGAQDAAAQVRELLRGVSDVGYMIYAK